MIMNGLSEAVSGSFTSTIAQRLDSPLAADFKRGEDGLADEGP